ncbi:MAG TPA: S9 family peptidase [Usitatibacter sp.]|jgi:dipeptidyl aminopeptidase/acylaminoacyl peptidase|nr:S9 family peptidase [Usitatibacter sp.]
MKVAHLAAATLAAAASIAATAALAQGPDVPLIARASIFGNPTKAQGLVSPDGKWISWIAPRDGVLNVWVAPAGDPAKARALTSEKVRPIRQHFWTQDSRMILFVNDHGGDENYLLYGVSPEGGEVKNFTPFAKTQVNFLGDSRKHRNEVLIGLNNRDPKFHDVYRLNTSTGALKLVYENHEFAGFMADDSLTVRFAQREKPGGASEILRFDAGRTEPFATVPAEDSITTQAVGLSADGKTVYAIDSRGRDKAALVALDAASGKEQVLGESAKADVAAVMQNPVTLVPEAYSVNYLKNEWFPVGDAVKSDIAALNGLVKGQWTVVSRDNADRHWVIYADEVTRPITYYLYDRKAKKLDKLFVTRPDLDGKPLAPMYGVEIKARDGLTLVAMLSLPVGSADGMRPRKPLPMILDVHGGPWYQDKFGYNSEAQWMANRGYAVLQVNYRGSTGFGKAFVEAANHQFSGKMHDDLIDAVKWAVDNGITTADKVAIYGGSYGGYATLVGMTFTPTTFACGVDIVGPSNLVTLIQSFPEYWKPFMEGSWYRRVGNPEKPEDRERLMAASPITRMDRIQRPLLIAQGANDPRVTRKESDSIVHAMVEKKIPVTYVVYDDEGHGFARPENRISFYAISEAFLSKCLGGRAEPMTSFPGAHIVVPEGAEAVPGLTQAIAMR